MLTTRLAKANTGLREQARQSLHRRCVGVSIGEHVLEDLCRNGNHIFIYSVA